jgi:hypothetical protein
LLQRLVEDLPPAFVFELAGFCGRGILVSEALNFLDGAGHGCHPGPAIDHHQNQNERPHGAQEHGQEGERIDANDMAPLLHAAAPGLLDMPDWDAWAVSR